MWEYLLHSQHEVTKALQEEREGGALLGKGDFFQGATTIKAKIFRVQEGFERGKNNMVNN